MKKVIIVQSIPQALELIKKMVSHSFSNLNGSVLYESNFEKTLEIIPKTGDVIVIASDFYHDEKHVKFKREEKDGNRLAQEIKKINAQAKVYIFSTYEPKGEYIDGFYQKSEGGANTVEEMVGILFDLDLDI